MVVSDLRHVQTVFGHEGRTYILDATPFTDSGAAAEEARLPDTRPSNPRQVAAVTPPQKREVDEPIIEAFAVNPQALLTSTRAALTRKLAVLFGIADRPSANEVDEQALYREVIDRVTRLDTGDPILRTYQTATTAVKGMTDANELAKLERYLISYRAATPQQLQYGSMRLPFYEPEVFDLLLQTVRRLQDYIRE